MTNWTRRAYKVLPVHDMKADRGSRRTAPLIHNHDTRRRGLRSSAVRLRHGAASRKVAVSIPHGVFWRPTPNMALRSNQPLTKISKGSRFVWLTILPPLCTDCLTILGTLTSWSLMGLSGTHYTRSRVQPRASLDVLEKRKLPSPYQDTNPGASNSLPSHYTY